MKKKIKKALHKFATRSLVVSLVVAMSGILSVGNAKAAEVTSRSDVMTRLEAGVDSNHTITFTTPSGIPASGVFTVTFPAGFVTTDVDVADIDLKDDGNDLTLAGTATGATWGVGVSGQVITFTNGSAAVIANSIMEIQIGTVAESGTDMILNPGVGVYQISIGGAFGDTGDIAVEIIGDDTVNVTATVDETINFDISDTTIGFGPLTSGAARFANGAADGSASETAAHTITVGTNATGGYALTYTGSTLTSGSDSINVATIAGIANGTPGTEQFAIKFSATGGPTIASAYNQASNNASFVAGTTTQVVSDAGPTADDVISAYYLANISSLTEAGSYSTDITYIATATF